MFKSFTNTNPDLVQIHLLKGNNNIFDTYPVLDPTKYYHIFLNSVMFETYVVKKKKKR